MGCSRPPFAWLGGLPLPRRYWAIERQPNRPAATCTVRHSASRRRSRAFSLTLIRVSCRHANVVPQDNFPRSGPDAGKLSSDHNPLGGIVRRTGSNRVSHKEPAPPKPRDILWKSAEDPLWLRYQEVVRLRRAVQEAEAAADQSSRKGENR